MTTPRRRKWSPGMPTSTVATGLVPVAGTASGAPRDKWSPGNPTTAVSGSTPDASADKKFDGDAFASIAAWLKEYGLEALIETVKDWLIDQKSEDQIMLEIYEHKEFKKEFPEIALRKDKKLVPMTVAEILTYRKTGAQMMHAAGLPKDFYDGKDDFTKFMAGDVSLEELSNRIQLGREAAYNAPKEVRDALMRDYGVDEGGLTAFFLDPDRAQPLLEKQYNAAKIGGASTRTGFGTDRAQNERLAELGITADQAQQGFGRLVESAELFTPLNDTEDRIDTDTQLGAAFGGDAKASQRIERRRRGRQSQFEGGGSVAASQQGVVGLSDTRR